MSSDLRSCCSTRVCSISKYILTLGYIPSQWEGLQAWFQEDKEEDEHNRRHLWLRRASHPWRIACSITFQSLCICQYFVPYERRGVVLQLLVDWEFGWGFLTTRWGFWSQHVPPPPLPMLLHNSKQNPKHHSPRVNILNTFILHIRPNWKKALLNLLSCINILK